jgi:pimeloyl-ACP methyl ester carboxylesterase
MPLHETDFGTVETLEWGDGEDLVVLLHALASGPWGFGPLAERLLRPGRRIVAPALHGYGGTRVAGADHPVRAHLAVARWALGSGGRPVLLFGHSMGGLTALLAAAGRDDLAALVLFEPIVHASLDRDDPEDRALGALERGMIRRIREGVDRGDPEPALAAFIEAWNEARWGALPPKLRERLLADAERLAVETATVADYTLPAGFWPTVATPTTVLYGDRSMALAARFAQRLAQRLPTARARCLPGFGHMAPALAADAVATAVEEVLAART